MTIPTFKKLFVIRIVASSSFGLFNKSKIKFDFDEFSCFSLSVSCGDNEKKADSALEIRAESNNKTKTINIKRITFPSGLTMSKFKKLDGGSVISI